MKQQKLRAVYMRGGTSRCLVFRAEDLPAPGPARDAILLAALGSPDPYGRQLDGLGGGISSLSKACIIGPPTLPGADVDYTFAQVEVKKAFVDYAGNCGNCSSAVGPFAIDEGLVRATEGVTRVRIHNTNTKKLIVAHVPVEDGEAAVGGDLELAGVAGRGARIALDGLRYPADAADVVGRAISMGNCHRAFPLTVAMCLAVAARIDGTLVHECVVGSSRAATAPPGRPERGGAGGHVGAPGSNDVRLAHPSGVLPLDAAVTLRHGVPWAERVTVYRSARRLMEGFVRVP